MSLWVKKPNTGRERMFPLSTPIADMASNVYEPGLPISSIRPRSDCRSHALSA